MLLGGLFYFLKLVNVVPAYNFTLQTCLIVKLMMGLRFKLYPTYL